MKLHLINIQGKKNKHWIIECSGNTNSIHSGSDLNKLTAKTTSYKDSSEASFKYTNEIWKKMAAGYIYKNNNPTNTPGECLLHLRAPNKSTSEFIDIHPDGTFLIIASKVKAAVAVEFHLLNIESGFLTLVHTETAGSDQVVIHSVHFDSTGNKIVYLLNTEYKVFDLEQKKTASICRYDQFSDGPNPFCARPMFDAARNHYLHWDRNAVMVRDHSWKSIFKVDLTYKNNTAECRMGCISPSGKLVALHHVSRHLVYGHADAVSDKTNRIDVWDVEKNKVVSEIEVRDLKLLKMKFNATETEIVFTHRYAEGPGFFDIKSGKLLGHYKDSYRTDRWFTCFDFEFSSDGKYLAAGMALFESNVEQKRILRFEENNKRDYLVLFSNDSTLYIQGGDSGEIFVRSIKAQE